MIPATLSELTHDEIEAGVCTRSLAWFVRRGWQVLHPGQTIVWGPHLQAICDHVQAVIEDLVAVRAKRLDRMRVQNLLINIPPRCGKTMIVGVFAPIWAWLHDARLKIRYVTCNEKVRKNTSRSARDLVDSSWFKRVFAPTWSVRDDQDAIESWANTARGAFDFSTIQGRIIGTGSDLLLCDDPHDAGESESEVKREDTIDRWRRAIRNRVNDQSAHARIGIMQRLHEADWSTQFLSEGARHLCIPMEYEVKPACTCADCTTGVSFLGWRDWRTTDGELMQPERFDAAMLAVERVALGSYGYAGQMQQRPAPAEGGIFKRAWFTTYDIPPDKFDQIILAADTAISEKTTADFTSIIVMGAKGSHRYVLDVVTARMEFPVLIERLKGVIARWKPRAVLVESAGPSGKGTAQSLKAAGIGSVIEIKPDGDKMVRAMGVTPIVEAGDIYLPRAAPWRDGWLHEVCTFPAAPHDDQVDAFVYAIRYMRDRVVASAKSWAM